MPNTQRPVISEQRVRERLKLVPEEEKGRYYLYVGATSDKEQLKEAVRLVNEIPEVIGIKMFAGKSTGNLEITDVNEQRAVYRVLAEAGYSGLLAVHCEKEEFMKNIFDPKEPYSHALSRPKKAEIESLRDQIKFAKEENFKGIFHMCHVSCPESVDMLAESGINYSCGITPHHLMWDESKYDSESGLLYKMNPPLRGKEDVSKLREYLKIGKINWVESDHAPHTIGEKFHDGHPSGYPSLYLYKNLKNFLSRIGLDEEQIRRPFEKSGG